LASFLVGAACSAIIINLARRSHLASQYALPLMPAAVPVADDVFKLRRGHA